MLLPGAGPFWLFFSCFSPVCDSYLNSHDVLYPFCNKKAEGEEEEGTKKRKEVKSQATGAAASNASSSPLRLSARSTLEVIVRTNLKELARRRKNLIPPLLLRRNWLKVCKESMEFSIHT